MQYATTERKPNVILADLIRCCLFTQRLRAVSQHEIFKTVSAASAFQLG